MLHSEITDHIQNAVDRKRNHVNQRSKSEFTFRHQEKVIVNNCNNWKVHVQMEIYKNKISNQNYSNLSPSK